MHAPLVALAALLALPQAPSELEGVRAALQARLDAYVSAGGVPGASAGVILPDGSVLALCSGVSDREAKRPLAPGDRMLAGSVGKTFVAAVCLQLVSEGELALDELVGERLGAEDWYERLPNAAELRLRHLLGHRSGLQRYEFQPAFARDLAAEPDRVWKPAELLAYVLDHEPLFAPGEGFAYSDTNYVLVGLMIESATGSSLYAEVRERLLAPLELDGIVPSDARVVPGLVQGYAGKNDPLGLPDEMLDAEGRFCINPQFEWAGGGFASTAGDLARWARALFAGEVLGADGRALMLDAEPANELGAGVRYGLGSIVWPTAHGKAVGHSGFFPGYLTEVRHWPERGVTIAIQVNTSDGRALPEPLAALAADLFELAGS